MAAPAFCADAVLWGSADHGLRLGIDFGADASKPELRVTLRNVGSEPVKVLIGADVGSGISLALRFFGLAPNGTAREGFERNSFTPMAGLMVPIAITLQPAETHELHIPLREILLIDKTQNTFEDLLSQRFSFEVSLDSANIGLMCPSEPPACWIGKVISGRLTAPSRPAWARS